MMAVAVIGLILAASYAAYLFHRAYHFGRIRPCSHSPTHPPTISLLIPARNESAMIAGCLHSAMAQDYAGLVEIIVIDDHSEDDTVAKVQELTQGDARIRLIRLENGEGKKAAIAAGVASAAGEIILTTDADCRAGSSWISAMANCFAEEVQLVSGPVVLEGGGLFRRMQALEFMGLIAVGAGSMQAGQPNMCNGANLAYRKSGFESVGGFGGVDDIASGDDELLMHKIVAGGGAVRFAKDKRAIVRTPAQATLAAFGRQRRRWVSKSRHYRDRRITWRLTASYLAMLFIPLMAGLGFIDPRMWIASAMALVLKAIGEFAILYPAAIFFDKLALMPLLPVEQPFHLMYVLWVGGAGNLGAYHWKGRSVK